MFKWFKKHFIPHEGNGHRPHFLERRNVFRLGALILFLELALFILPTANFARYSKEFGIGSVLPGVLSSLTNEERSKENLPILAENSLLVQAAQLKAEDMASKSYFAHTSPEGKAPWYWFNQVGYVYAFAGENLAVNFTDSEKVTEAWMNSPTHRANIVAGAYTEVGTGVATGTYKGYESIFVAQVYGRPLVKSQLVAGAGASNWQELLASPRNAVDVFLAVALGLVIAALLLNLFVRFEHRHPDLWKNALFMIIFILAVHLGNNYVASQSIETSFMAFSPEQAVE